MRHVPDSERRARLAVRHALAPGHRVGSPREVTRVMGALHATDAATVYLSIRARADGVGVAEIERALSAERTLVKQLAMRRTLWVFPRERLPAAWGSASARVAGTERRAMARDLVRAGLAPDGEVWLHDARARVLTALRAAPPAGLTAAEIRTAAPGNDVRVAVSPGAVWGASRVLVHLGLTADVLRGANTGHWRTSRPRWVLTGRWLGDPVPAPLPAADGWRELTADWLRAFGPGTLEDIVWWLGATKAIVRTALSELGAVEVELDHGRRGWLAADDLAEVADPGPWVALLPVLDPTTMGWRERDFYLGPHRDALFDANGNGGTTAWVDGRIVGCWTQDDAGRVRLHLREPVTARARHALASEAERLTAWLDGVRIATGWASPAMRQALAADPDPAT